MNPRKYRKSLFTLASAIVLVLTLLLPGLTPTVSAATPTVNGLFYGDGDDALYTLWNTSYYGSELYVHYDAPTTTLYVAMVVDPSVNDNVFTKYDKKGGADSAAYMSSAGWGGGGGQQRPAATLTDSEFGAFEFACALNSPNSWSWGQAYGCAPTPSSDPWTSRADCGSGSGTPPPSYTSSSSIVWNINNYRSQYGTTAPPSGSPPWDLYTYGTTTSDWKSPFAAADPNTVPGDWSGYSTTYEWEWRMVYEWSVNLTTAGCGSNALYLVSGLSHHSPMKDGVAGTYDPECGLENDCFPPPNGGGDPDPMSDWGDLPDTFGTTATNNGPRHIITINGPYLGSEIDMESDGQPAAQATDDGADEDGVTLVTPLVPGEQACVEVDAVNTTGSNAYLYGWIDFNGDGDFASDTNELLSTGDFAGGAVTIAGSVSDQQYCFTVPGGATFDGGETHMRFRLSTDTGLSYTGEASDGEVEDYHQELACVGNYVWQDADGQGDQDGSESGIAGVIVELWQDGGTSALTSTTTDGSGNYQFCGLMSGDYYIVIPASNFGSGQPLENLAKNTTGAADPDGDSDDTDDNGIQAGGAGTQTVSPVFTIAPGTEPVLDGGDDGGAVNNHPDNQVEFTVDMGFYRETGPTAVSLISFAAKPRTESVLLSWESAAELDILGFNLYRAESPEGTWLPLNTELIASQTPGSPVGAAYEFADGAAKAGTPYYYQLEIVDTSGTATSYGIVTATMPTTEQPVTVFRVFLPMVSR